MSLKIIQSNEQFGSLAQDWNDLLSISASHVPFLRHEYLYTWWQTLGGGEWQDGDLYIITDQSPGGKFTAIAPFFLTHNQAGDKALMFLGSFEISDYLDFIAPQEHLAAFLQQVLDYLVSPQAPDWEIIDLYNILDSSPALSLLEKLCQSLNLHCQIERLQPAPYIPLPDDWETYLAGLKKKQRHEIRRKLRRANEHPEGVRWYIVEDESTLNQEIDDFLNLMAQDEEKRSFLTEVMSNQMRASVHSAFKAKWLQLAFLEVNGKKAAAYLNFDFANQIWVYNSGIDFSYSNLSPGWVLLANLIQWAIENGREAFDFMRGDEDYKYRFGGVNRYVMRVQIRK